jgi:hypothetical protein
MGMAVDGSVRILMHAPQPHIKPGEAVVISAYHADHKSLRLGVAHSSDRPKADISSMRQVITKHQIAPGRRIDSPCKTCNDKKDRQQIINAINAPKTLKPLFHEPYSFIYI